MKLHIQASDVLSPCIFSACTHANKSRLLPQLISCFCTPSRCLPNKVLSSMPTARVWPKGEGRGHRPPDAYAAQLRYGTAHRVCVPCAFFPVLLWLGAPNCLNEPAFNSSDPSQICIQRTVQSQLASACVPLWSALKCNLRPLRCRQEHGDSYAIDLGGTNFRVLHVRLSKELSKLVRTSFIVSWLSPCSTCCCSPCCAR